MGGTSSRIYWTSSRNPTGRPLEFCKFASNDLELPISLRNAIKNFTGRPLENSRGRPVEFTGRPVNSTGHPLEFSRGRPLNFFIAFLDEIGNSMSFEANLQNSSGRPVGFLEDIQ